MEWKANNPEMGTKSPQLSLICRSITELKICKTTSYTLLAKR
jgi:hypothetical protein